MKTLRKIIPFLLLGASACTTTGCSIHHSKAAEKSKIVGTYELTEYKGEKTFKAEEKYDRKAEEGIVAYFSIDIDGYCYYGYKDNQTAAWVKQGFATFNPDSKEEDKYESVKITDGVSNVMDYNKKVGCMDESPMGFYFTEKKRDGVAGFFGKKDEICTLSYTDPAWEKPISHTKVYYQYVCYTKISSETGLAKINSLMGTSVSFVKPYEIKQASGYYVYRCESINDSGIGPRNMYEYAILDMDSYSNGKAKVYYSTVENPEQHVVDATFSMGTKGYSMNASILGSNFQSSSLGVSFNTETKEGGPIIRESFTKYYGEGLTLNEIIDKEREPQYSPYVLYNIVPGQKKYAGMLRNSETGEIYVNGLELNANDEFAINTSLGGIWKYFEDYVDEGTAGGKVVQGSKAGTTWTSENEEADIHYLKATETGLYNIKVDSEGKVHIVHE